MTGQFEETLGQVEEATGQLEGQGTGTGIWRDQGLGPGTGCVG